jgi:hypothetical protein|tara:strand:+ start:91 stop:366 length:276 start_codon:yes stop_codon:yes gene_type:complete
MSDKMSEKFQSFKSELKQLMEKYGDTCITCEMSGEGFGLQGQGCDGEGLAVNVEMKLSITGEDGHIEEHVMEEGQSWLMASDLKKTLYRTY